MEKGKDED